MLYRYKIEDQHRNLVLEQVWEIKDKEGKQDFSVYDRLSEKEHKEIGQYVPAAPKVVLDFGCGLGRASIYLNFIYKDPKIKFILADRDGFTENSGHFNPEKDEYYNDLELTRDFCKLNGLENVLLFDTEKGNWNKLPKVDFITSRCSLGMHVPIERYIDRLCKIASKDCVFIFGTRHSSYNEESFSDLFKTVIFLPQNNEYPFPRQSWLILKDKIEV